MKKMMAMVVRMRLVMARLRTAGLFSSRLNTFSSSLSSNCSRKIVMLGKTSLERKLSIKISLFKRALTKGLRKAKQSLVP